MVDFKTFERAIKSIKTYHDMLQKLSDVLKIEGIIADTFIEGVTNYLIVTCKDESRWIDYWMWELDFGKKYTVGTVTEEINGKKVNIPLKTIRNLYNALKNNYDR